MNKKTQKEKETKIMSQEKKESETPEYYFDFLTEYLKAGKPIYSNRNKDKQLQIADDEIFMPCYADEPQMFQVFPKYWFISQYNRLLSTYGDKVVWLEEHQRKDGNKCYKWRISKNPNRTKTIESHNLVGLVFGSDIYGKAAELLAEKGVYAFGKKQIGIAAGNGHHKDGNHSNNTPVNIQFVSTDVHRRLLDRVSRARTTQKQELNFMQEFSQIAEQEEPNKATILFSGERYNLAGEPIENDNNVSIHAKDINYSEIKDAINDFLKNSKKIIIEK